MNVKNKLLIILGFLFLFVGTIGIFMPILPTTPFVLLAATCFSNNPKLNTWLHRNKIFSDYIANYKERTGLKKSTIIISLIFLWCSLMVSIACIKAVWAYILLPCIGVFVTVNILYMSLPKKVSEHRKSVMRAKK